jgi:diguanylate cyclase (GGDEF)-like protein/PAS domain S-box-containing protein
MDSGDLAALRRLYEITGRITSGRTLDHTLQAIVDAVVEGVGFGVAVVNYRHPDGSFEVVAVSGSDEARAELLGCRYEAHEFESELARADAWGRLRYVPHHRYEQDMRAWVPDGTTCATGAPAEQDPDTWHPLDALYAPLHGAGGELVGVLSVDLPAGGRRPGPLTLELLEMFAAQAGIAVDNARLTDELRRERQELQASEEAFRLAFEGAGTGMSVVSLDPTEPGRLLRVNPSLCDLLGYRAEDLLGMTFSEITHPDDVAYSAEVFAQAMESEFSTVYQHEKRYLRGDGRPVWVAVTTSVVRTADGRARNAISQVEDITTRKAAEDELVRRALRDPLTGVANRDALSGALVSAINRARKEGVTSALLFCDLDDFKAVNDTYGHDMGDAVLAIVAERLSAQVRPTDTVARLGGDEFVVLAEDMTGEDLASLVERIERVVATPIRHAEDQVAVAVSVGVSIIDAATDDARSALRDSDRAMYLVKADRRRRPPVHEVS